MADQHLTLHPQNNQGSLDTSINIYPKIKTEDIIDIFDANATNKIQQKLSVSAPLVLGNSSGGTTPLSINLISTEIKNALLQLVYPIGSIYISTNSTSPANFLGGSWEQIKDKFILAAGDSYTAGNTGGEASHILLENELPNHTHTFSGDTTGNTLASGQIGGVLGLRYATTEPFTRSSEWYVNGLATVGAGNDETHKVTFNGTHEHSYSGTTSSTGSGNAHNNMPPYLVAYMWKRTA